jgi:hypothetical protein
MRAWAEVVDVLGGAGEVDELGRRRPRVGAKALRQPVLDAFTSWFVVGSIAFTRSASATENPAAAALERGARLVREALERLEDGLIGEARSHATSTATRSRMSANSLKCSCQRATLEA